MLRAAGFQLSHGAEYTEQMGVEHRQLARWGVGDSEAPPSARFTGYYGFP